MFAFVVESSVLKNFVSSVASVVPGKALNPILSNVRLSLTESGTVELSASDARMHVVVRFNPDKPVNHGSVCLPADKLTGVANSMVGKVTINIDNNTASFHSLNGKDRKQATIHGIDPELFPDQRSFSDKCYKSTVLFDDLKQAVSKAALTADRNDNGSPVLTGINLHFETDTLVLSSTDRYRASIAKIPCFSEVLQSVVLPASSLSNAVGVFDRLQDENVDIESNKDFVRLVSATASVQIIPISGTFPNIEKVIPTKLEVISTLPLKPLIQSCKDVAIVSKMIDLEITFPSVNHSAELIVRGEDSEIGNIEQSFEIKAIGKQSSVVLNLDYLSAFLSIVARYGFGSVQLIISEKSRSVILHPVKEDGSPDLNYTTSIMAVYKE